MNRKTYQERLDNCEHPLLKKLFKIIIEKRSNLCVAANFKTTEDLLEFVDRVGKHICILKTQLERSGEVSKRILEALYEKKRQHNFLLFEDRKFFDGEETIQSIYSEMYVRYVDLVTVIPICGDGIFKAIENAVLRANLPVDEPRGCLAVCELSFKGFIPTSPNQLLEVAEQNSSICCGIIAQALQVKDNCRMIKATPGVHLTQSGDGGNQQWNHPSRVLANGADVIIVGRGIVSAPKSDLERVACQYKEAAWRAYTDVVQMQQN